LSIPEFDTVASYIFRVYPGLREHFLKNARHSFVLFRIFNIILTVHRRRKHVRFSVASLTVEAQLEGSSDIKAAKKEWAHLVLFEGDEEDDN
jgi:hypothetical protein